MQKKLIALFMTVALVFGVFNTFCVASATDCSVEITENNGAYGEYYGSVNDSLSEETLKSKEFPVKKGLVYAYPGITVAQLINSFGNNKNIAVTDNKQDVETDSKVKSGSTITLKSDGYILDSANIAVLGDIDANGSCQVTDISTVINHILYDNSFSNLQFASADVNRTGTLTVSDVVKMRKMILNSDDYVGMSPETGLYLTSQYVANAYNLPMWEGNTVYQETAVVTKNSEGEYNDIQLLYDIDEIIEVRNFALSKTYIYDKDYTVDNGKIKILDGTTIPSILETATDNAAGFGNGDRLLQYQISVTYTHNDSWDGFVPSDKSANLSKFYQKLDAGEDVNMVFFGDSITVGYHSSGMKEGDAWKYISAANSNTGSTIVVDRQTAMTEYGFPAYDQIMLAPYAPNWAHTVHSKMQEKYPESKINYINVAAGSSDSSNHGVANLQKAVIDKDPDIVFIAFGTNEPKRIKEYMKENHKIMIDGILAANPDCAIVLVSPTVPNLDNTGSAQNFALFQEAYYELQSEYTDAQIAVVPVYDVAQVMMERKLYRDVSGNNINHPNDFGSRVYSHSVMKVLGLYD